MVGQGKVRPVLSSPQETCRVQIGNAQDSSRWLQICCLNLLRQHHNPTPVPFDNRSRQLRGKLDAVDLGDLDVPNSERSDIPPDYGCIAVALHIYVAEGWFEAISLDDFGHMPAR